MHKSTHNVAMFTGGDAKVTALTGTGAGGFCETIGRVSDRLHGTSCVQGSARYVHEHLAASFAMAHMPARAALSHTQASMLMHKYVHNMYHRPQPGIHFTSRKAKKSCGLWNRSRPTSKFCKLRRNRSALAQRKIRKKERNGRETLPCQHLRIKFVRSSSWYCVCV